MVQRTATAAIAPVARAAAALALLAGLAAIGQLAAHHGRLPLPGSVVGLLLYLALLRLLPGAMLFSLGMARALVAWIGLFVAPPAARALVEIAALEPSMLARLIVVLVASTAITGLATAALVRWAWR